MQYETYLMGNTGAHDVA
jgi:hypothetical protein